MFPNIKLKYMTALKANDVYRYTPKSLKIGRELVAAENNALAKHIQCLKEMACRSVSV
jgi:hypothetical protein